MTHKTLKNTQFFPTGGEGEGLYFKNVASIYGRGVEVSFKKPSGLMRMK